METHTGGQFARHLENISLVTVKGCCCRIDSIRLESNDSSKLKSTHLPEVNLHDTYTESNPQVATK